MSAPNSTGLEAGYKVEPASNGGWILTNNHPPHHCARMLGAFTNWADLIDHLSHAHSQILTDKAIREAKERLEGLKLEEPADTSPDAEPKRAPIGQYRLQTFTWSISGPAKVPATQIRNEIFEDIDVARRVGIAECERGYFAFVYDDQGKLVVEVKP